MIEKLVDSILERRIVDDGLHKIELIINEEQFNKFYDDVDEGSVQDMVRTYLDEKADDGRPHDISFEFDNFKHIIKVNANLQYLGNDYSDYKNR